MRRFRKKLSIAVLWAMIPLTVLGSTPHTGCICANGQYKLFCGRHVQGSCQRGADALVPEGGCICCHRSHGRPVAKTINHRERVPLTCCGHRGHGHPNPQGIAQSNTDRCCKPVVTAAEMPPVVEVVSVADLSAEQPLIPAIDLPKPVVHCVSADVAWERALPAADLIVAHQVFLI